MNFTTYAQTKGLDLLPDDIRWLRTIITKIPPNDRKRVLEQYVTIWREVLGPETKASCAMNLGRSRANNWVREQVGGA